MASEGFQATRLIAAVASGQSVSALLAALRELADTGFPVLSARLTANQLTDPALLSSPITRISPTNSDQAVSLAAYLKSTSAQSAIVVRSSDPNDSYSQSLADAFTEAFPDAEHSLLQPQEVYDPGATSGVMRLLLANLCSRNPQPDAIFFAGRSAELRELIKALPYRSCLDQAVTIVSGDDAVDFATSISGDAELSRGLQANATVTYSALAHPDAWTNPEAQDNFNPEATYPFQETCVGQECFFAMFPGDSLDDGAAIMGHDAILTVATAARFGPVAQTLRRLHGELSVPGASGWLSFAPDGSAINKAVPVLQVTAEGVVHLVALSSPLGVPCYPGRQPC